MKIKSAKYFKDYTGKNSVVKITDENGIIMDVPLDEANTHYAEIKRQVDAGELTIEDAD
tara:strand:+ start:1084 stop:1260 length:177 start_codon:yes stop_codon:yes gene_type:complete